MNFQVTVLKILVSYLDGFAVMADLNAIWRFSRRAGGRDWADRTKRLAARVPELDIFSQGLVERLNGGWRITEKGRVVLEFMEARPVEMRRESDEAPAEPPATKQASSHLAARRSGRSQRLQRRRVARERARAKAC
ncbi:hypothetical protein LPJ38_27055 [Bradyrhizobium daqingense]|uniref:Uncharacterized protein n=1 Tax=Bradyrhizobium daqingense TaxID=993502 RepID=A0A562LMH9_9BRAD|nr:hypothetical protein [Bradyrhizobium daqingense]TWI08803.1 hypothetical protein IQ17_01626 [Bradyrhizobium daqingense]UFS87283.1 hypothetical protein LPJ38_27055 [Bradyrhizobium daqingense]